MSVTVLPPRLDLAAAQPVLCALKAAAADAPVTHLDASAVDSIGTACIQLLLALDSSLSARGGRIYLDASSPAFTEAFQLLGLQSIHDRWQA
ncbi:MAG: STAS domain-containing protein [Alphaproteobacteria bacterium]|nr:MAG: STAS domain-containing protein [Alphaproteobacteria bacterium]